MGQVVLELERDMMANTKEKQEASGLALTAGPLHMSFPLSDPLIPEDWLPQSTHVAQITNSKAFPAPLEVLSKRENEIYCPPCFLSCPFLSQPLSPAGNLSRIK